MTPEELQELRDWSARKVGWEYRNLSDTWYHPQEHKTILSEEWENFWLPDRPESGQIWMLIGRMLKLGWEFQLLTIANGYEANFSFNHGKFLINGDIETYGSDLNPCIATIKAAKATEG